MGVRNIVTDEMDGEYKVGSVMHDWGGELSYYEECEAAANVLRAHGVAANTYSILAQLEHNGKRARDYKAAAVAWSKNNRRG